MKVEPTPLRDLVKDFYDAFLAADRDALAAVVSREAAWTVPLDTAISGVHVGPDGIAALRQQLSELTGNSWRPLREDSFDIATSDWHVVIMDRFLASRDARRLDSHEAVIAAIADGRITRLFHYLHDPDGFAAFWSR